MKKTVCMGFFLLLVSFPLLKAQSVTLYLCNNCTYSSASDGQTITFLTNGQVKINGKLSPQFSCYNNDGIITLKYKGKIINHLNWFTAQEKGYELFDDRGIGYNLVKCSGDMPSIWQINNPQKSKKPIGRR